MAGEKRAREIAGLVMDEGPNSDGSTASLILNWQLDERGFLDSTFRLMPLIPDEWVGATQPTAFLSTQMAMLAGSMDGNRPELLFLTSDGVFRFYPGRRAAGGANPGLEEQFQYNRVNGTASIKPQGRVAYPPQIVQVGNRFYWSFCDGGGAFVWDGDRIRSFGFSTKPSPINAEGPTRLRGSSGAGTYTGLNRGGFGVQGRIGSTEPDWTTPAFEVVGGIDDGLWRYGLVFEGPDGAYSETSASGAAVSIVRALAEDIYKGPDYLRRRFRLRDIPVGPVGTVARILLRTRNLRRLPVGDDGSFRFLHRIPNNLASEYIDDIPDGELGPIWRNRMSVPIGVYFLRSFGGSFWLMRTDGNPSRVWFSEQENVSGPTPESYMEGSWIDVFPETGPITGGLSVVLNQYAAVLLVFKERAVHFIHGQYPAWQVGTLHAGAGCAGPELAQAAPDGSVIWYGSRTFWRMTPDGQVSDIGSPIRKSLRGVNQLYAHMGISWPDRRAGQVHFILPMGTSSEPDLQFVFDYRVGGWRLKRDVKGNAVTVLPMLDVVLVAGTYLGLRTVWVLGRGYAGYDLEPPTAVYRSGWVSLNDPGPNMHGAWRATNLLLTMEERSEQTGQFRTFTEWNLDEPIMGADLDETVVGINPESSDQQAACYAPATSVATYDSSVWRDVRAYSLRIPMDTVSASVVLAEVRTTTPLAIQGMQLQGVLTGPPGAKTPTTPGSS